jgi:hypothetical protein
MRSSRFWCTHAAVLAFAGVVGLMDRPAWAIGRKAQVVYAAPAPAAAPAYYAPAAAPAYYAPAPAAYAPAPAYYAPQPSYYVTGKHHKQYLLSPAPYGSAPYYAGTTQAAAPAQAPTPSQAQAPAAAPAQGQTANAPSDTGTATDEGSQFQLSGAILDTFVDDLRRYYASNTDNQGGLAKVVALRDEARRLYTSFTGGNEVAPNSEVDLRIRKIVDQVVKEDRDRTAKLSRRSRSTFDEDDEDRRGTWPYYYPPPGYAPIGYYQQPAPMYYVPAYQTKHHGH